MGASFLTIISSITELESDLNPEASESELG
jgi:hypothetical protein